MKKSIRSLAPILACFLLCSILSGCGPVKEVHLKPGEAAIIDTGNETLPVSFDSSDPSVAAVDETGLITAVTEGTARITATNSKGMPAFYKVIVDRIEPESISFNNTSYILAPEEETESELIFKPDNTTYFSVSYASDNRAVAVVDQNGVIKGVAPGRAVITARTGNGHSAECAVTVVPYAERIRMESALKMGVGETADLSVAYEPENCREEAILWTSSDEAVAAVEAGTVTASGEGTAVITAEGALSGISAQCRVSVGPTPLQIVSVNKGVITLVSGAAYQILYDVSAEAKGGTEPYLYKFDILQEGVETATTGWIDQNGFDGEAKGKGSCVLRVTVRDDADHTVAEEYDMLETG